MTQLSFDPVRQPRLRLTINGQVLDGAVSAHVSSTAHLQAARWNASVALTTAFPASFWANMSQGTAIQIDVSLNSSDWITLVTGDVDDLDVDIESGLVDVSGRDLGARLLDAKTSEAWPNHRSSDIVSMLAQRHGLTADVTPTSTPVGQFYQLEHARTSGASFNKFSNQWELCVYLAQHENYTLRVDGSTLQFHPRDSSTQTFDVTFDASQNPPVSNVGQLKLKRSLTIARDISVIVRSWDSKKSAVHEVKATRSRSSGSKSSTPQQYVYTRPGLSPQAAQTFANSMLAQLSIQEKAIDFDCPGELQLYPDAMIRLTGTGTDFDQSYYVDSIERSIDVENGFHQHVSAKNHDPDSEISEG